MGYTILTSLLLYALYKWCINAHLRKLERDERIKMTMRVFALELQTLTNGVRSPAMDPVLLDRAIRLCHPDKHGGSKMATEVTQQLLKMRG